jgi:uncharacterized YccA/Bax inhibitor family protein
MPYSKVCLLGICYFEANILNCDTGVQHSTFAVCLGLYKYRIVKVTEQFKSVVVAATLAIATYYIILVVVYSVFCPVHHGNSMMSIGISVFVIIIAALNLFFDFDRIEKKWNKKMPKYGVVWCDGTNDYLVWLYIEFLRLLSNFQVTTNQNLIFKINPSITERVFMLLFKSNKMR